MPSFTTRAIHAIGLAIVLSLFAALISTSPATAKDNPRGRQMPQTLQPEVETAINMVQDDRNDPVPTGWIAHPCQGQSIDATTYWDGDAGQWHVTGSFTHTNPDFSGSEPVRIVIQSGVNSTSHSLDPTDFLHEISQGDDGSSITQTAVHNFDVVSELIDFDGGDTITITGMKVKRWSNKAWIECSASTTFAICAVDIVGTPDLQATYDPSSLDPANNVSWDGALTFNGPLNSVPGLNVGVTYEINPVPGSSADLSHLPGSVVPSSLAPTSFELDGSGATWDLGEAIDDLILTQATSVRVTFAVAWPNLQGGGDTAGCNRDWFATSKTIDVVISD